MKQFLDKYKIHLFSLVVIFLVSAAYVPEAFKGKVLQQSDITQYKGAASEIFNYRETKDEEIRWTNSQFAGMPTYMISGLSHTVALKWLRFPTKPVTWEKIFLYLLCGYIMFIAFGVRPWLAVVGAIGLGLATENLTIINVGHNTKSLAIAYLPLVIAGVQFIFRKKYLLGLTVLAAGMGLELLVNHLQITYYGGILIGLFFVFQFVKHIQEKKIKDFGIATGLSILGVLLALGANSLPLLMTNEYSKDTIRSTSELTIKKEGDKVVKKESISSGLSSSYAFSYSNGWTDIPATFIPNYSGGDSDKSGLYYGDIGSTSGPKYVGATMFILMVIGFFVLQGAFRWWLLTGMLLAIALSMGQNHFSWLSDFFFNNVPLYNKFRAPSMIMVLVQICVGILAIVGLEKFFSLPKNDEKTSKRLLYSGLGTIAFALILTFFSTAFNDFNSNPSYDPISGAVVYDNDTRFAQSNMQRAGQEVTQAGIDRFKDAIAEQRVEAMKKDGYRTIFFMAAIFALLWFYYKGKIETKYVILIIGLLVTMDMWTVGKRYLNKKDFKNKSLVENAVRPSQTDLAIQQDKSYYRVLDLTVNPLASSRTSFFHKSLGGYNAAKMRRYQEIWDWHLIGDMQKGKIADNNILHMFNTKYIMFPNREKPGSPPNYTPNPNALGNAWFISNIKNVKSADSAIIALGNLNTVNTALIEDEFSAYATGFGFDSSATIELLTYHPEKLEYESNTSVEGFAVFSEVYYDKGWNAYIDDELVDYCRTNYILRGLKVPAGKHKVTFKFEPKTYDLGMTIGNISSGIISLLVLVTLGLWVKSTFFNKDKQAA